MGVRFSPSPKPQATSLYPQLDLPRYVHDSHDASKSDAGSYAPIAGEQLSPGVDAPGTIPSASESSFQPSQSSDESEAQGVLEHNIADSQPSEAEPPATPVEPPSTALAYQISHELFHKARESPAGSPGSYWSHTMYRSTKEDGTTQNVKVHYCSSKGAMEWVCSKHFLGEPVLGFDLEWLPRATGKGTSRQNVSLIQLASPSRIALFHCSLFEKDDFIADSFRTIMEDSNVSKTGVAIKADCTRLEKWMGVKTKGILELSHLHKMVKYTREERPDLINKSFVSLAGLVQEYLGLPLYKGDSVRSSDWTKSLSTKQITCKIYHIPLLGHYANFTQIRPPMPMLVFSFSTLLTKHGRSWILAHLVLTLLSSVFRFRYQSIRRRILKKSPPLRLRKKRQQSLPPPHQRHPRPLHLLNKSQQPPPQQHQRPRRKQRPQIHHQIVTGASQSQKLKSKSTDSRGANPALSGQQPYEHITSGTSTGI